MDADQDLNFVVAWNRFNLALVGIWPGPLRVSNWISGISRIRFLIASFFMLGFICIPQSANLMFIWGNADMITENLATANIPVTNAFMKAFAIWRHRKALRSLVDFFYEDWRAPKTLQERATMVRGARLVRNISIWCSLLTQIMLAMYLILRMLKIAKYWQSASTRPLLYTAYFPFDITRNPVFLGICACQIISAYSVLLAYTGCDSFISMLVLHTCSQFENLRAKLKSLADMPRDAKSAEQFKRELTWIVKRHEHLNWFAKTIEDSFNMVFFLQMFFCTVQLCFQGFQLFGVIISESKDGSATFQLIFQTIFVGFVLAHLYVYCYVGEMLLVQSAEIGFSAYESNWFDMPGREARNLLLIMHRSMIPLCLTAGKFSAFSLKMFSTIIRTSLGYLSVLLTVTDRS